MKYIVTARRDIYHEAGVEFAGVFDTKEKANVAKNIVEVWMSEEGWKDSGVYIHPCEENCLAWYSIKKQIFGAEEATVGYLLTEA